MDPTTIQLAKTGDKVALERVISHVTPYIEMAVGRFRMSDADTADMCQDAKLKVLTTIGSFSGKAAITSWAYAIARNLTLDRIAHGRFETYWEEVPEVETPAPGADVIFESLELQAAINELPEYMRCVVVGHYLKGDSFEELSHRLGISEATVRGRLHRARKLLRERL